MYLKLEQIKQGIYKTSSNSLKVFNSLADLKTMFSKYVESVLAHIGFLPLLQNRQERMLYFSSRVSRL